MMVSRFKFSVGNISMACYTISDENGCKVVRGSVPLMEIAALMQEWAKCAEEGCTEEWFVDSKLSSMIGVNVVCGPRTATTAWRFSLGIQ